MPYSAQVTQRARQQLAQRKADRESQYNHNLQEAYIKVPRLREIDLQMRKTVILAAQTAFMKGEEGRQAMLDWLVANI